MSVEIETKLVCNDSELKNRIVNAFVQLTKLPDQRGVESFVNNMSVLLDGYNIENHHNLKNCLEGIKFVDNPQQANTVTLRFNCDNNPDAFIKTLEVMLIEVGVDSVETKIVKLN